MIGSDPVVKFEKYPAYKYSGVEWLGYIPEHWEYEKLFGLCRFIRGNSTFGKDELLDKGDYVALQYGKTYKVTEVNEKYPFYVNNEFYKDSQVVNLGDTILISTSETLVDLGHTVFYNRNDLGLLGGEQTLLKPDEEKINAKFLYYSSIVFSKELRKYASGVKVFRFNIKDLKTIYTAIPPLPEQTAIANFLNEKSTKIDEAIAQKERMIALLKERKQIIIQNAVKQGLDPNVKMKDSGVEWIGEIPEHWRIEKLFGVCCFVRGNSTFSKDELLSKGQFVALQYGKSYKVTEVDEEYDFYVNNEFYKESQVVNYGDTVFISTSETIEDLGHTVFYNRNDLGLLGGEQILLKPNTDFVQSKYLHYSAKVFSKELRKYATGIKVFRFNINDLKTIYTPVPNLDEQLLIVEHIDSQLKKIAQAITQQQTQIKKLKEYKATLIDSVVTGKIKVC